MASEEFLTLYEGRSRAELVRGNVILPPPETPTVVSRVELNAEAAFASFIEQQRCGWLFSGGVHVLTESLTVRVADLAYWDSSRSPRRTRAQERICTPPDLVLEIRRVTEPWLGRFMRMVEYLRAEVRVVLIADEVTASVCAYRPDSPPEIFEKDQTFTLPDVLPGFEVPVARFFEE